MHMLSFDLNSFDGFHGIYSTFLTFLFLEGKNNSMEVRKARKTMFAFSTSGREQCPCSGFFGICHRYHDTCPLTMENSSRRCCGRRPQRNFADVSRPSRIDRRDGGRQIAKEGILARLYDVPFVVQSLDPFHMSMTCSVLGGGRWLGSLLALNLHM